MKPKLWFALTLILAALALSNAGCFTAATPDSDPEAYAVYSTLLPKGWLVESAHATRYVIISETSTWGAGLTPKGESAKRLRGAIESHQRVNGRRWHLQPRFTLDMPYQLISESDFDTQARRELKKGIGADYGSIYPGSGGVVCLSAVGFNRKKDVAVVQMQWICGPTCGGVEPYVFEKKDGKWIPLKFEGSRSITRY